MRQEYLETIRITTASGKRPDLDDLENAKSFIFYTIENQEYLQL